MLQQSLGGAWAQMSMKKIFHQSVFFLFLVTIGMCFYSCDKITSSIKDEFNSERSFPAAISPSSGKQDNQTSQEDAAPSSSQLGFVYFVRGNKISLSLLKKSHNLYLLHMTRIGNPLIAFGGVEETNANYINNLIFFNQWGNGVSRSGALILLKNAPYDIPKDPCMTVLVSQPHYDIDSDSASFILEPQEPVRSDFLSPNLDSCVLLIKAE